MALVSTSSGELEEIRDLTSPWPRTFMQNLPSKVEALISDLKGLPLDVKWYFPLQSSKMLKCADTQQHCILNLEANP
jgi:hypothetical protein